MPRICRYSSRSCMAIASNIQSAIDYPQPLPTRKREEPKLLAIVVEQTIYEYFNPASLVRVAARAERVTIDNKARADPRDHLRPIVQTHRTHEVAPN